jgi:hypothetical protein
MAGVDTLLVRDLFVFFGSTHSIAILLYILESQRG